MTALLYFLGFLTGAAAAYLVSLIISAGKTEADEKTAFDTASRQIMKY